MSRPSAPVELTGGAGFNFEDKVAAFFLASMLSGTRPYGTDLGTISAVSWQTRDLGWLLDDLLVEFQRPEPGMLALSIKDNRQVTGSGFPSAFVDAAWEQFSVSTPSPFQPDRDLLGLAVGELAGGVREAWNGLLRDALRATPDRVVERNSAPRQSNEIGRRMLLSLARGEAEASPKTVRFLRHLRLLHFDFRETGSKHEGLALWACQQAVQSGQQAQAGALWQHLLSIAADHRSAGGRIDLTQLLSLVRGAFELTGRLDQASEWSTLDRYSADRSGQVADSLAARISVIRQTAINEVRNLLADGRCVLLTGDGGAGKSALAKRLVQGRLPFLRYVWLDAASLDHDSLGELERHIGISAHLKDLLVTCADARSCLVIDGLETLTERATARATAILGALSPSPAARGWSVLATTRPHANQRQALLTAGIDPDSISEYYVQGPSKDECNEILAMDSRLQAALLKREFRASLRNFKLLDWILRGAQDLPEAELKTWFGISHVIDSLWKRWVGVDASAAPRAGVMKRLAQLEGQGLSQGIGTSELTHVELASLSELELRELLRVRDERVSFNHEMLGDWARLRLLIEQADTASALINHAQFPRWHDAIRLLGQRLLETDSSAPNQWVQTIRSLGSESPSSAVARDMLLEGLFCSSDARRLIDQAWPVLCDDGGTLLRRMLNRFKFAATIPDPRFTGMPRSESESAAIEARWRFPWWPLWPSVLAALADHSRDIAELAPIEGAEVCRLWLANMPVGTSSRLEASLLALAIGREIQAARGEGLRYLEDDADKTIFEAVLLGAPDLPDDVSAISLELCRRRPDPPNVTTRAETHERRISLRHPNQRSHASPRTADAIFSRGTLREQFPDGPASPVDAGLQSAVLGTHGILALAGVRPDVAREVLLACTLEGPQYESSDELSYFIDELGVEDPRGSYPPMFYKGPWLQLLRKDSRLGIECIVRLVNQATRTWEDHQVPPNADARYRAGTRTMLLLDGVAIECVGDGRVYGWFRDRFCAANQLVSALMALERYIYERIDQDLPVDDEVEQVLRSGRSVALLAVLVAAGMYRPALLAGPLRPLLGVWRLYEWDMQLVLAADEWNRVFIQWAQSGELVMKTVRDWHSMTHRRRLFRECAQYLMLSQRQMTGAFDAIRAAWRADLNSGSCVHPEALELLIARLDPSNYTVKKTSDSFVEASLEWPDELKPRVEEDSRRSASAMVLASFPIECRSLLDAGQQLSREAAEAVWMQLRELVSHTPMQGSNADQDQRSQAILGGIAVLMSLATPWLSEDDARRRWCMSTFHAVFLEPPSRSGLEADLYVGSDLWSGFAAEIGVAAFSESSSNVEFRALAAEAVASFNPATTAIGLGAAYRRRDALGDDFVCMVNLAVLWAAERAVYSPYESPEVERGKLIARRTQLIRRFVDRRVPAGMMDWTTLRGSAPRHVNLRRPMPGSGGRRQRITRPPSEFDLHALQHAFAWLPAPATTLPAEKDGNVAWLRALLDVTLRTIPATDDGDHDEVHGTPYEFDRWVFRKVAMFVAQMDDSEGPSELWRQILQLGPGAHYWVESFLNAWCSDGHSAAESLETFFMRWREMMDFALHSEIWLKPAKTAHYRLPGLWEHLLGMNLAAPIVADARSQEHFEQLVPVYRQWAEAFLTDDRSLRAFLYLLNQEGARPLLCPSISWILRAAEKIGPIKWTRHGLADEVASVLRVAWASHARLISTDSELFQSFSRLLNVLVVQQSPVAMNLRERVSRGAPATS